MFRLVRGWTRVQRLGGLDVRVGSLKFVCVGVKTGVKIDQEEL